MTDQEPGSEKTTDEAEAAWAKANPKAAKAGKHPDAPKGSSTSTK